MRTERIHRLRHRPAIETRQDQRNRCANCGHDEFVIIERAPRKPHGPKLGVDVERCERCGRPRHT